MFNLIGQSLGRYHILEQFGEGGMASVYRAFDTRLERDVAIKVILPSHSQSEQFLKRFDREAKALAHLSHPNIVKVLDYGTQDNIPYLVMEFIPGGTLREKMGQPLPWQEAARLLLPIARALQYAHQENVVHRDVKPANILLTRSGEPMLSDFGIAKILETEETMSLTGTGAGIGTPEYMAPEQGMGQKIDHRADVYALGTVLYEMVTGRKPYRADTPVAVLIKKNTEPLPRPRQFSPNLPDEVEGILLKALARDPANRYADMGQFAAALERACARPQPEVMETQRVHMPEVNPESIPAEKKKPPRAILPLAIGIVVTSVLLLIGLVLVGRWWMNRAKPAATATSTLRLEPTFTSQAEISSRIPTDTIPPAASPTVEVTLAPTAKPVAGPTASVDGAALLLVPAGDFIMGSNSNEPYFWGAESPRHTVYLDSFLIYQTEVTNAMYLLCVQAGVCPAPEQFGSRTRSSYFNNPQYGNYPVVYVTYADAVTYCSWAKARLPTEAEWEKAARGTDGRLFPWGDAALQANYANFCDAGCPNPEPAEIESMLNDGYRDTAPVGSFQAGASSYGALDMAGNVLEWTADWMAPYSGDATLQNPTGPATGSRRVTRGGSWFSGRAGLRTSARASFAPDKTYDLLGFRCAVDAP